MLPAADPREGAGLLPLFRRGVLVGGGMALSGSCCSLSRLIGVGGSEAACCSGSWSCSIGTPVVSLRGERHGGSCPREGGLSAVSLALLALAICWATVWSSSVTFARVASVSCGRGWSCSAPTIHSRLAATWVAPPCALSWATRVS